jgi:DNA invertase Pin-like site-specific DNA recombinase
MRRLIDSFAEYERLIISARTRAALAAKRRRGERVSRFAPYGYRLSADGRTLELEPREQQIASIIRERRAAGEALQGIAALLNAAGMTTRAGSPWRYQYIQDVLKQQPIACNAAA